MLAVGQSELTRGCPEGQTQGFGLGWQQSAGSGREIPPAFCPGMCPGSCSGGGTDAFVLAGCL